jgi:hypothetical protein
VILDRQPRRARRQPPIRRVIQAGGGSSLPSRFAPNSDIRRLTRITVDGNPPVQMDFALKGVELPGLDATAARVLNAIPALCASNPGVRSALDLVIAAQAAPS